MSRKLLPVATAMPRARAEAVAIITLHLARLQRPRTRRLPIHPNPPHSSACSDGIVETTRFDDAQEVYAEVTQHPRRLH